MPLAPLPPPNVALLHNNTKLFTRLRRGMRRVKAERTATTTTSTITTAVGIVDAADEPVLNNTT